MTSFIVRLLHIAARGALQKSCKSSAEKLVFKSFLKLLGLGTLRMWVGSTFHADGPACENARFQQLLTVHVTYCTTSVYQCDTNVRNDKLL